MAAASDAPPLSHLVNFGYLLRNLRWWKMNANEGEEQDTP
jgi:hypothetical protein